MKTLINCLMIVLAATIIIVMFEDGASSAEVEDVRVHGTHRIGTYELRGEFFTAQEFRFDMPRTFESGSCIAAGGTLLLRLPESSWYCKEQVGFGTYSLEKL